MCIRDRNIAIVGATGNVGRKLIEVLEKKKFPITLIKNFEKGPCNAVKQGLQASQAQCKIVYPADDFLNIGLIDVMFEKFLTEKADVVVASRFMEGGSMKGCPILKSILVRIASSTLFFFFQYSCQGR